MVYSGFQGYRLKSSLLHSNLPAVRPAHLHPLAQRDSDAYSAEIFPLAQREQGMAFCVAVCLFFATVLSITFFRILGAFGPIGAFGLYAGFNVVAFILIFLFLPETKGRTLEELDQVFSVPTHTFAHYQVTKTLPYWFRRYALFDRSAKLEPLYKVEDEMVGTGGKE